MAKSKLSSLMSFDRQIFAAETGRQLPKPTPRAGGRKADQLKLISSAHSYVIGVDEVGRGCLAGPVVAAAVMLPIMEVRSPLASKLSRLDDSKVVPEPVRMELQAAICASSHFSVAEASPAEIDEINILNASLLAMKRAVLELLLKLPVDASELLVLVDGNRQIKEFQLQQKTVVQGDSTSASIAAASIVAKVYRDRLMCELSEQFPHYLWHKNKGYGSRAHREALAVHGCTAWHRQSFRLFAVGSESDYDAELDLESENEVADLEKAEEILAR